jgi:hypothetical protein
VIQYGVVELAELVKLVGAGVISEAEAARRVVNPEWVWDDAQVREAVQYIDRTRCEGNLPIAQAFATLLMTAVERRQPTSWRNAALAFVQVATEVVAEGCDGKLYRRVAGLAESLLADADANTLLAVAHFKLEPFAVDPIRGTFPERKQVCELRQGRRRFEVSPDFGSLPVAAALAEAQVLFARFAGMTTGVGRGVALVEQAYAAYSLGQSGADVDPESYLALCFEGWPLLEGEPLGTARACWLLAKHDAWRRVQGRPLVLPDADLLMNAYGPRTASAIIAVGASLFGRNEPGVARGRCEQAAAALPGEGFEPQRAWLTGMVAHLLPDDPTDCVTAALPSAVANMVARGRAAGWTRSQISDAMVHALAHDVGGEPADADGIAPQVRDSALFIQVLAEREERLASALMSAHEDAAAVVRLIRAAGLHAESGSVQAAENCLYAVAALVESSHEAACVAVDELTLLADALAVSLDRIGAAALDEIYTFCFCQLNGEGRDLPLTALV